MRIACVSTILGYPWGSPDRLWTDLAGRCLARGDAVFLGLSPLTADHAAVRALCAGGAELFGRAANSVYRGARDELARLLPWRRDRYLETRLTAFAPDVVLLTQGATYDSLAEHHLIGWLHSTGTPYVVICHNNPPGPAPSAEEQERLRRFFAGSARTLFVSTENLARARQHLGAELPRSGLVQNPLAAGLPDPLPFPAPCDPPVIGLLGRLDIHHKGLDLLLAALAKLPAPRPRLVLTGRCDETARLQSLIREHGLEADVETRAAVPAAGVTRAMGELELFLLPSRFEGCSSAMLEAMMCGRAVLATPVGGVSDWVEDGVTGYCAPAITSDALHTTLVRALADRARWPALGRAARARFDQQRDPDPVKSLLGFVDAQNKTRHLT